MAMKNTMTVKKYLELREQQISKKKFDKLVKAIADVPMESEVKWAYLPGETKAADGDGNGTLDLITTIDIDRDNEVLIPSGCDLRGYAKTPTVLFGHNYNGIPVGVSKWQKPDTKGILSLTEYFTSQFAKDVKEAALAGALANSVGFIPKKWVTKDDDNYEEVKKQFNVKGNPRYIFTQWQLLEYSKVPVPANPEAITMAMKSAKSDEMKKFLETEMSLLKTTGGQKEVEAGEERTIYLFGDINSNVAKQVCEELIALDRQSQEPVQIIIGSYGGEVYPAFSIIDTIKVLKSPVETIGMGMVMSAGLLIFMTGNTRKISSNASILSHRFWSGLFGSQAELVASRVEHDRLHQRIIDLYKEHTTLKTNEEVLNILLKETDVWLTAQQAVEYGIADQVLQKDDFTKTVNAEEIITKMFGGFMQKAIVKGGTPEAPEQKEDFGPVVEVVERLVSVFDWKCPHCQQVIAEKSLYYDGKDWFHRPCIDQGKIILPKEDDLISEKAGAVLNRKNKEALQKAQALIQQVLDSAAEGDDDDDKQKQTSEGAQKTDVERTETDDAPGNKGDKTEGVATGDDAQKKEQERLEHEKKEAEMFRTINEKIAGLQKRINYLTGTVD